MITDAVDALPDDLPTGLAADAERHLVGPAADQDAKDLRHLGRRLMEVIAPDLADEHVGRSLGAAFSRGHPSVPGAGRR